MKKKHRTITKGTDHLRRINAFRQMQDRPMQNFSRLSSASTSNRRITNKETAFIGLTCLLILSGSLIPMTSATSEQQDFKDCSPNWGNVGTAAGVGFLAGARAGRAAGPAGMAAGAGAGVVIGGGAALVKETVKAVDCMSEKVSETSTSGNTNSAGN